MLAGITLHHPLMKMLHLQDCAISVLSVKTNFTDHLVSVVCMGWGLIISLGGKKCTLYDQNYQVTSTFSFLYFRVFYPMNKI